MVDVLASAAHMLKFTMVEILFKESNGSLFALTDKYSGISCHNVTGFQVQQKFS